MTERITVAPDQTMWSSGFDVTPPTIRNLNLLHPGPRSLMEASWQRSAFEPRPIEIFRLRDVFVIDEGIIFDRDLRLLENISNHRSDAEVEAAAEIIRAERQSGRLPHLPGLSILARRRAAANYGHFMLEILPILHVSKALVDTAATRLLVMRADPPMLDAMFRAFRLLGLGLARTFMTDFGQPVACSELLVIRGLTEHGAYMSPNAVEACARIAAPIPAGDARRIFVKRVPSYARSGRLRNEADLSRRLETIGFQVVEPGSLTLEQQIATFKGAHHVVGVMGAAMTNIVFCEPGTKVTLLAPTHFPDVFFWFIAQHRQIDYAELRGRTLPVPGMDTWAGDFSLDEEDVAWLEAEAGPVPPVASHLQRTRLEPIAPLADAPNILMSRLVPA